MSNHKTFRTIPSFSTATFEVHQQPDAQARYSQVAQELRVVNRCDRLNRLDFENNCAPDDEVEALFAKQLASVCHRVPFLALEGDPGRAKLQCDRARVDGLEQAGTERAMDRGAATNGVVH